MNRSLWSVWGIGLVITLLGPGCSNGDDDDDTGDTGGSPLTPSQVCSSLAYDQCDKVYSCASPAQLRSLGYPDSKLDCGSQAIEQLGCTTASQAKLCEGPGSVSAADAAACSAQVKSASCADASSKPVSTFAPKCGQCAMQP